MKIFKSASTFIVLFIIAAMFYVFYSVHSEYYQGVRSVESYRYAKAATASAEGYYSINSTYPVHIDDLKLSKPDSEHIGNISVDNITGAILIRFAANDFDEGMFIFTPTIDKNAGSVSYACQSIDIPSKYVPEECQTMLNPESRSTARGGG